VSAAEPLERGASLGRCAASWAVARRVEAGEWDLRYREAGEGPPIVLVHGLAVSSDYWWRNGPDLAVAGHRVLAPDLPGFGRSPGPKKGLSVTEQSAALLQWADALGLEPAVYVGHSLSCQTLMQLGADRPDRVAGLVLAAPTGEPTPHRLVKQAVGLARDVPRESLRLLAEVFAAYLHAGPRRFLRTWTMGARHDPVPLLPRIDAPGIVVLGTRDPVVPRDFAAGLARGLGAEDVTWIEGAAHAVIFTHAEPLNRAILEFAAAVAERLPGRVPGGEERERSAARQTLGDGPGEKG
jgi:2-hydroxy-6-oxonona-2,4-dienedioate hydrolase